MAQHHNRNPFQGVSNIVRFNYHFYLTTIVSIIISLITSLFLPLSIALWLYLGALLLLLTTSNSLVVAYYVYDRSKLYDLPFLDHVPTDICQKTLNITAGFDETSSLICQRFPLQTLTVIDFYQAEQHTERAIKQARKLYAPYPNTQTVMTNNLPFAKQEFDWIIATFAIHEIRNQQERIVFLKELRRMLKENGQIIITEHLRDLPNFLAFNIGFFHFYSYANWQKTFNAAELQLIRTKNITPFVTTFFLTKNHESNNTP